MAKGYLQIKELNYGEIFSTVIKLTAIQIMLSIILS